MNFKQKNYQTHKVLNFFSRALLLNVQLKETHTEIVVQNRQIKYQNVYILVDGCVSVSEFPNQIVLINMP